MIEIFQCVQLRGARRDVKVIIGGTRIREASSRNSCSTTSADRSVNNVLSYRIIATTFGLSFLQVSGN